MIVIDKEKAIEAYIIRKTTKMAVLEMQRLEILMNESENVEDDILKILTSEKPNVSFINEMSDKIEKLEKLEQEIHDIDLELKAIVFDQKNFNGKNIIFE